MAIDRPKEGLALEWHFGEVFRVRFPLMPLVAYNVIAVENGDSVNRIVLPPSAGVGNRLRKEERRSCRTAIVLPQKAVPITG